MVEVPKPKSRNQNLPELIQGGMGAGVSNWKLARSVAIAGEKLNEDVLGVVSGVGLSATMVHRLTHGDSNTMQALQAFPVPEIAQELIDKYWKKPNKFSAFTLSPKPEVLVNGSKAGKDLLTKLLVVSNFAEIWLAKQGHNGPIGINYLEKLQLPHLPEIYGAMLADVDYILMGAGLPLQIPGILDNFAKNEPATYKIDVTGAEQHTMNFNPAVIEGEHTSPLIRPNFLAVVSLHVAAQALMQRANGEINGFVVENPKAGGHNAPPRSKEVDEHGVPQYGPKDIPDLGKVLKLGVPVWLAGAHASPKGLREAKASGAAGIQVGSAFALSNESGMDDEIKKTVRKKGFEGNLYVMPNSKVSPTGFPFQVAHLEGSLSEPDVYANVVRRSCDYGFLPEAYLTPKGRIGFRCPAEPIDEYVAKGGKREDAEGTICLCRGLGATVNIAPGPPIITLGQDLNFLPELMESPDDSYSAEDVIRYITF